MQSNVWLTALFPLTPVSLRLVSVSFYPYFILFSFPSLAVARLHVYSFRPCAAFTLPLTGRAAVHDTYPAESSRAGSMEGGRLRGKTHNPPLFFPHGVYVCDCSSYRPCRTRSGTNDDQFSYSIEISTNFSFIFPLHKRIFFRHH